MEILDPDLWNDDGTPKRPSKEYMERLEQAQSADGGAFLNYARIKRDARAARSPEVGDIVHWWDVEDATCRAAMVMETESFGDGALLRVHIPHEAFQDWQCDHDENKGDGTFHWPCGEGQ
jgi:hypothetical protein